MKILIVDDDDALLGFFAEGRPPIQAAARPAGHMTRVLPR